MIIEIYVEKGHAVWVGAACEDSWVLASAFSQSEEAVIEKLFRRIPFDKPFQTFSEPSAFAKKSLVLIKNIHDGKDARNDADLKMSDLPFYTQQVLKTVRNIPTGYVSTYGEVAKATNGGARAVGNIMANNRFPPIVPCHRVVAADLKLGGYGGGIKLKMELLAKEKRGYSEPRRITFDEKELSVFPIEFLFRDTNKFS